MPNSEISAREMADGLRDVLTAFDENSSTEMEIFNNFLKLKHTQLEAQKELFIRKYGEESEKVAAIKKRLDADPDIFKTVEAEVALAKFVTPPFVATGWRVQGFVYDEKGNKVAGKKVSLVKGETNEPVKNARVATSGDNGYYSITLKAEEVKALKNIKLSLALMIKDQEPFIAVTDIHAVSGRIDHEDIWPEGSV
jgi:hypothetical protein